jgi:hypothetical protein
MQEENSSSSTPKMDMTVTATEDVAEIGEYNIPVLHLRYEFARPAHY